MADSKPYGDVKYADPKNGKYPIDTAAHAKAAWDYVIVQKNADQYPVNGVALAPVKAAIMAACKHFGIDVAADDSKQPASRAEFRRTYPLEGLNIIRAADGGNGRTVEAFAAVFNEPAEIQDHEGHYIEVIDPTAFDSAIEFAGRNKGGFAQNVKVIYNHGRTNDGLPSERFQMPIGVPVYIKAESGGVLTRTLYNETQLAEEVLENIRAGSITSQSFVGRIIRSDPQLGRGARYRPDAAGNLRTVRRMKLGLREYGPVLWPAYSGADILGVRMSTPGSFSPDPDEHEEQDPGTPPDEGPAAGDPLSRTEGEEHSARYHQHALYAMRSRELREKAGLDW
jgi:phage head maturation protease